MIAAIYIENGVLPNIFGKNHDRITLNLGGKYLYEVVGNGKEASIKTKKPNPRYVEDFWHERILNVSAIVGENGTGKTTILEFLKEGCPVVIEEGDTCKVADSLDNHFVFYYTSHLTESRTGANKSNVFNLSKQSRMTMDTENESGSFAALWEYYVSEGLKRSIDLVNDPILSKEIDGLGITRFQNIDIQFHRIFGDSSNLPLKFKPFFTAVNKLIIDERSERQQKVIDEYGLDSKNPKYSIEMHEKNLELQILDSVIHKLISLMHWTGNGYLNKGLLKDQKAIDGGKFSRDTNTRDALYWFLDNAYIDPHARLSKNEEPLSEEAFQLPKEEVRSLVETLLDFVKGSDPSVGWTTLRLDFERVKEIIQAYQNFLLAFKDKFIYDEKLFMKFTTDKKLSAGEELLYELFSTFYWINNRIENKLPFEGYDIDEDQNSYIFLLDEADLGFHPHWKRKYVKLLNEMLPVIFTDKNIQVIFTTHDPLTLSDLPNENIVYLKKEGKETRALKHEDPERPTKSFAANITDLLSDSFFIKDGLIGDFAKDKIQEVIDSLQYHINKNMANEESKVATQIVKKPIGKGHKPKGRTYLEKMISLIDEPILKHKLEEMWELAFPDSVNKSDAINRIRQIIKDADLSKGDIEGLEGEY
jgi:predicted ATPase